MTTYLECPRCRMKVKANIPTHQGIIKRLVDLSVNIPHIEPIKKLLRKNKSLFEAKESLYNVNSLYTYKELFDDSLKFAKQLTSLNFDCIIGLPRNGLIVASLIASYTGTPLSTPDDFKRGVVWRSRSIEPKPISSVLLVDEIMSSGRNMREALNLIKDSKLKISTATLLIPKSNKIRPDYTFREIDGQACEWEIKDEGKRKW